MEIGRQIDRKDKQPENPDWMRDGFELRSIREQREKQVAGTVSREDGKRMDDGEEQSCNANSSIDESRDPLSNAIIATSLQQKKQRAPKAVTEKGIKTETSKGHVQKATSARPESRDIA
jgi:hypothetical protein